MKKTSLSLSAAQTLQLGGSIDRVLCVTEGCLELFLVWDSTVMKGRRHHIASIEAGRWAFDVGFAFRDHGVSLLAVGQAGTQLDVYELDPRGIALPIESQDGAVPLDHWLEVVTKGLSRLAADDQPRTVYLTRGNVPALKAGFVAGARDEPLWWKFSSPDASFLGVKEVDVEYVPLTVDGWVQGISAIERSEGLTTREMLAKPDWVDELSRAHDLFLRTMQATVTQKGAEELERRAARVRIREASGEDAWQNIASVLTDEEPGRRGAADASTLSSIVFAFENVAHWMGISPNVPASFSRDTAGLSPTDALAKLVRQSSSRMRRVLLEGNWYRRDNGPLIAFLKETGEAVALRPRRSGRYEIFRADGSQADVRGETLTALEPFAYCLYRSLPDRKLTFRDIVRFSFWGNRRDVMQLLTMVVSAGLLGLVMPMLTGKIFDVVIPQGERELMLQITAALVAAALIRVMLEVVRGLALMKIQNRMDANLQAAIWDRLLKMPARFFRKHTAGDLVNRSMGITEMHDTLSSVGATVLCALPAGVLNFFVMFSYDKTLALVGLGLALLAVLVSVVLNARQVLLLRRQYEIQGRLAGLVFQLINGVAKIRLAGNERLAFGVWARDFTQQERLSVQAGRWGVATHTFFAGFTLFSSLVIFAVVAQLMAKAGPTFTTGSFLAFNTAFGALVGSLVLVGNSSLDLLKLFPLFERTKPILEAEPETSTDRLPPGKLEGEIEMANLRFRYAEDVPHILNGFSLRIQSGEFVALVGPSGSGKSTILRLLLGFETPESGSIFYDGKDLQTLDLREVRRQIGVVLQSSNLIAGDIFRNIVGESSLTLEDAWKAAEMAGMADDIRAMAMQMYTVIGEGGAGFSGGQRQRLAIARAIAHNPRLIFFDEATSALDNRTQATVTASLDRMKATRIVIAHRLSTVKNADRIVFLQNGRVVEDGTYDELMAQKGLFHHLAIRQLMETE